MTLRIVSDDEADDFPLTEDPGEPTEDRKERWRQQVIDEQTNEHPAFRAEVPQD